MQDFPTTRVPPAMTIRTISATAMLVGIAGIASSAAIGAAPRPDSRVTALAGLNRDAWRTLQQGDAPHADPRTAPTPPPPPPPMFRTYDGFGNNPQFPDWGAAGAWYLRGPSGSHYADGLNSPAGADRPSARAISNAIVAQGGPPTPDERGLATAIYEFGQFLDHDIGLAQSGSSEAFDIAVPAGDPWFDPGASGAEVIYFDRSGFDPQTGADVPREQVNTITAFIDGSQIYGSDGARAAWLRTFSGGGMKTAPGDAGAYLPLNDGTQANDNPVGAPATSLRVAGDVRANEQPGLTVLHTVFLREHNRHAARLAQDHPDWDDERLYQEARKIVGAELQVITEREFLPALLGHPLPPYTGWKPGVNPSLSNVFATAAYRFGHSQVGPDIELIGPAFRVFGVIELADAFFNPDAIPSAGGIDPFLRYFATDTAQRVDNRIVDALRNFLFGPPGSGGFDLASLNIQRGRDHGLPDYNTVRADFGLPRVRSFAEITSNSQLGTALHDLYGSVDRIDAWVGILAEDHIPGGSVGQTADRIITDQFVRLRDGDRFWYETAGFDPATLDMIRATRLVDVMALNSGAVGLQPEVFFAQNLSGPICFADMNADRVVDSRDFNLIARNFGLAVSPGTQGDLNGDGRVDRADFSLFLSNLGCDAR